MKLKLLLTLTAICSSTAFAFNNDNLWTPYDCISNSTYQVLFSGEFAFNHQIPGLIAQCEAQGGSLLYFAASS